MNMKPNASAPVALAVAAVTTAAHAAAPESDLEGFIAKVTSADDAVRGPAWQSAGPLGAPAVKPLAPVLSHEHFEIARAARRALWKIVRHAGRPGAAAEARAVEAELIPLLASSPTPVRRELLWMLSEIAGDTAIEPMAVFLADKDVREDARCALERIPGPKSLGALKHAFAIAPEDFKFNLAHSLRVRGETVSGYPSKKLVPTRQTGLKQPTL